MAPNMNQDISTSLNTAMTDVADKIEAEINKHLQIEQPEDSVISEPKLIQAMRHGSLNGGKRLRPFLLMQAANLFCVSEASALRAATALEMIHCYSLIHDDLPAMDDDDLRRGQPTVHKAYDEATAILAGDALLTMAFELSSHEETHANPAIRCEWVAALAKAAGPHGMVGGQMIDLEAEETTLDLSGITRLQRLKTGCLIEVACQGGAILGQASKAQRDALRGYAHDLGLAFQIADDLLDVESTEEETGKKVGKDADRGKETFVSLLGVDRAKAQAALLAEQAVDHLSDFDHKADLLREVAQFIVNRRS
ncbi:polyprenyl synthetase family protein [Curvivirga sp.]|uniref:polyprenyl synthetase family protein n=1 Tax=Curvivirga sp. TaxID=2856848 RepID=UPI003B5CB593